MTESIKNKIDESYEVCSGFLYLSKAFDTDNHKILINKLNCLGIRGVVGDLINSYLKKLNQFVALGKKFSKTSHKSMGVPQGSYLGPLLLLLYINDMAGCFSTPNAPVVLYADDSCVTFHSIADPKFY